MLAFELIARLRKELFITGSALYETVLAIAERVNRKVHILRLHAQATSVLAQIRAAHRQVGTRIADHLWSSPDRGQFPSDDVQSVTDVAAVVAAVARRARHHKDSLARIEGRIRELKSEEAHEELLLIQRDLGMRDAVMERVVVAHNAAVLGHPLGDFNLPPTTRVIAVFRGPFLLPLTGSLILRPDDIVLLAGLRVDLAEILPHFQNQRASKTA